MGMVLPIVMIVLSNVVYNLMTKATPADANPFAALVVTYATAGTVCLLLLLLNLNGKGIAVAFHSVNWTSFLLGASIVLLELGYIFAFRAGWNISICSLVANILLAVILLALGVLFYKERLSGNQFVGVALCLAGLFFVNRH